MVSRTQGGAMNPQIDPERRHTRTMVVDLDENLTKSRSGFGLEIPQNQEAEGWFVLQVLEDEAVVEIGLKADNFSGVKDPQLFKLKRVRLLLGKNEEMLSPRESADLKRREQSTQAQYMAEYRARQECEKMIEKLRDVLTPEQRTVFDSAHPPLLLSSQETPF